MTAHTTPAELNPSESEQLERLVELLAETNAPSDATAMGWQTGLTLMQQIGQWRLACGDVAMAGRWQSLAARTGTALSAAEASASAGQAPRSVAPWQREIRIQIENLLQELGQHNLAERLRPMRADWEQVLHLLADGRYTEAQALQQTHLHSELPPGEPAILLTLVPAWLQAGRDGAAIELLSSGDSALHPQMVGSAGLAAAIGWHLHRQHSDQARTWLERSLALDSTQALVAEILKSMAEAGQML